MSQNKIQAKRNSVKKLEAYIDNLFFIETCILIRKQSQLKKQLYANFIDDILESKDPEHEFIVEAQYIKETFDPKITDLKKFEDERQKLYENQMNKLTLGPAQNTNQLLSKLSFHSLTDNILSQNGLENNDTNNITNSTPNQIPSKPPKTQVSSKKVDFEQQKDPHICGQCGKSCGTLQQLLRHLDTHIEKIKCPKCNKKCADQSELDQHLAERHIERYNCNYCYASFPKQTLYLDHRRRCTMFRCKTCSKQFQTEKLRKEHQCPSKKK